MGGCILYDWYGIWGIKDMRVGVVGGVEGVEGVRRGWVRFSLPSSLELVCLKLLLGFASAVGLDLQPKILLA